jgi:hypothetical protein
VNVGAAEPLVNAGPAALLNADPAEAPRDARAAAS